MLANFISEMSALQLIGISLLSVGIIGTLFTSYRRFVYYMFFGAAGWGAIEALSYSLQTVGFSAFNAYAAVLSLCIISLFVWLVVTDSKRQQKKLEKHKSSYIGHTAMYHGEVPTSKWSLRFIASRLK